MKILPVQSTCVRHYILHEFQFISCFLSRNVHYSIYKYISKKFNSMEAALKSKTVGAVDLRSVIYHFQEATSDKLIWPDCPFKLDDIRQGIKIYLLF